MRYVEEKARGTARTLTEEKTGRRLAPEDRTTLPVSVRLPSPSLPREGEGSCS